MTATLYECEKCKDTGIIYNAKTNSARICECEERRRYQELLKKSGISKNFQKIGFKEFVAKTQFQKLAKSIAIEYVKIFENIESKRQNSIAFLGNCGAGKTHLNIGVLYMAYREEVTRIKQIITDDEEYAKTMNRYKNARVLLIDDFAKGKTTESDINIMFEIINFRYLNNKPVILSSELIQNQLLDFDEATGSRIIEMCRGRIVEVIGLENNYRLKKE